MCGIVGYVGSRPALDPLAERMKYLHDRLRITPAQEPLWANLAQVMRDNATAMAQLLKERFQTLKSGNAIDSITLDASGTVVKVLDVVNRPDNAVGSFARVWVQISKHYLEAALTAI